MEHLIKRTTGSGPADGKGADGATLAERLAASRGGAPKGKAAKGQEAAPAEETKAPAPAAPEAGAEGGVDTDAIVRAAKAERDGKGHPAGNGKSCLIVDDSRVIRKLAAKIMVDLGYQVSEAENGQEALARCQQEMPHLVLTDWNMPVMSGLDFVAALRATPTNRVPTIIFCTSKGDAKDIHAGIKAGADDYIVKPFEEAEVRQKLVNLGVF